MGRLSEPFFGWLTLITVMGLPAFAKPTTSARTKDRVIVLDRDARARHTLVRRLEDAGYFAYGVASIRELCDALVVEWHSSPHRSDTIVIGAGELNMWGVDLVSAHRAAGIESAPVLALTHFTEYDALKTGRRDVSQLLAHARAVSGDASAPNTNDCWVVSRR